MPKHHIKSLENNNVLFEGEFKTFKNCVETAINQRINLANANLRYNNLSNINLDDAIMPGADMRGSNLTGANLSEGYFKGTNFTQCALYNTCFVGSNLTSCNFADASFGATDIYDTIITNSQFSTQSCFGLNFQRTKNMQGCVFINIDGRILAMSKAPIVINGWKDSPVIILDNHIKHGANIIDQKRLAPLMKKLTSRSIHQRLRA